jgi:ubiquinone/menaquinone biosynthesis C-methylase UbiE
METTQSIMRWLVERIRKMSDPDLKQQIDSGQHYYNSGQHLRAKHTLMGDNFAKWVLDRIPQWTAKTILDAGGGWGRFVWLLMDSYDVKAQDIVLTDLSEGMLQTALAETVKRSIPISLAVCDIKSLPFESQLFDIVMANKVLYHLSDISQGVQDLARGLKPDGQLLATTNSDKITAMIIALHYQVLHTLGIPFTPEPPSPFSMENGGEILAKHFRHVEQYYYEDEELIYEASQIRATYETIGRYRNLLVRDDISDDDKKALPNTVEQLAQEIIYRDGVLRSPTLMGAFLCTVPIV